MYFYAIWLLAITIISKSTIVGQGVAKRPIPIETDFQIDFKQKKIYVNVTKHTVAEKWMIDRMSEIQKAIVSVRRNFFTRMKQYAWVVARNIELTMPDYYFCTLGAYNNIIRRDYFKYPDGLITEMRNTKETLFSSYVRKIPIYEVDSRTATQLNFYLNEMAGELKIHGQLMWELSETVVGYQEDELVETCGIPIGPRVPVANMTTVDYLGENEDYEPAQYLGF